MSIRIPKYRLHRASGQALVQIQGRRIYLGKYNCPESREKYWRIIAQMMRSDPVTFSGDDTNGSFTIDELVLKYFQHAKQYYRKNGRLTGEVAGVRVALRRLRRLYGGTIAGEFGPKKLKTLRQSLFQENLSTSYINSTLSRIRRMFKWAASEEKVPVEVYQALSTVSGLRKGRSAARETPPVLPVSDEIVEATLPHLPQVVADMVRLERLSGMRPSEVCQLRPCDLDRTGQVWLYWPDEHKTEHCQRDRVIPLGPRAQEVLWKYLARDLERYCFRPCDSEEKRRAQLTATRVTPLSCGNRSGTNKVAQPKRIAGEQYDANSYRRAVHRACDKAFPHPELSQLIRRQLEEEQAAELKKW